VLMVHSAAAMLTQPCLWPRADNVTESILLRRIYYYFQTKHETLCVTVNVATILNTKPVPGMNSWFNF